MIRIITEPSVFVLARQALDLDEIDRAIRHLGAPDWTTDAESASETLVEFAGRVCYDSFNSPRPGGNAAYINRIRGEGHGSVLEHAVWTILISGVSRSLTHELVRHRVGLSPSQLSQRFVDESNCAFVLPPVLMRALEAHHKVERSRQLGQTDLDELPEYEDARRFGIWERNVSWSVRVYGELYEMLSAGSWVAPGDHGTKKRKLAREAARSVLPNCVETRICLTGNARAWRHLIEMRGSEHADAEFRRLALVLLDVFRGEAPTLFGDYSVEHDDEGRPIGVTTPHRKV